MTRTKSDKTDFILHYRNDVGFCFLFFFWNLRLVNLISYLISQKPTTILIRSGKQIKKTLFSSNIPPYALPAIVFQSLNKSHKSTIYTTTLHDFHPSLGGDKNFIAFRIYRLVCHRKCYHNHMNHFIDANMLLMRGVFAASTAALLVVCKLYIYIYIYADKVHIKFRWTLIVQFYEWNTALCSLLYMSDTDATMMNGSHTKHTN